MEQAGDGYRRFLEVQVEALQDQLYGLERDPERPEHLKSILSISQRLRHAREADEPESVHLLRNAVEKVTLHLGRQDVPVSQDVLDFYVDTFDLLEEAVRRWPAGPAFDRARYAERVRGLLDLEAGDVALAPGRPRAAPAAGRPSAPPGGFRDGEPVEVALPDTGGTSFDAALAAPGLEPVAAGEQGAGTAAEVPTWIEPGPRESVEVLSARDVPDDERSLYLAADLEGLLVDPWAGSGQAASSPPAGPLAGLEPGGGLAASFATFEALRAGGLATESAPSAAPVREPGPGPEAERALARLRDVLDAFSVSLEEFDRASERLLVEEPQTLGRGTVSSLVDRLELEKQKLLAAFDRTIDSFRAGVL